MRKKYSCKIVVVGSIKIKLFDGIIRTLKNVRHVPELKKKIISLGFLDYGGHKFIAWGRVMKVSKGGLVVMKATKTRNLYKLDGSTRFNVAMMVFKEAIEFTCLWH
jgi:hypothetical protein